jgi:TolA-binding protein
MPRSTVAFLLLAGVAAIPVAAQTAGEEANLRARRLLEDGRTYWKEGKLKQALDNFNTIVTGFQNTDSVDDALLEIGRYHVDVDGNAAKGRENFETVTKRYPQSDGAPGAYYYLGLLTLGRAAGAADLDDALAQFDRVQRLYPKSEWVPRALHASGLVHRKAGRLPQAVEAQRRVSLEYPTSDVAPVAQFEIGHCLGLAGEPRQAMEEFQQVRNRFPPGEWSQRALERVTALYRLYGESKPGFTVDAAWSVGAGDVLKDVRALLMTPAGVLWIGSEKTGSAVSYDRAGKMGPSLPAVSVRSLSLAARGELMVTARLAVRIGSKDVRSFSVPGDKPVPEPLENLTAAAFTPGGSLLVADEKRKRVFRFDRDGKYVGVFPDNREREVTRIVVDGEGAIVLLDRDAKTIQVVDDSGRLLRSLGPRGTGFELRKPADVAVDPLRNLYVADEEGGVYVFSPQGQLLTVLAREELRKPRALTLDPNGALLVYDDRLQKVVRFK